MWRMNMCYPCKWLRKFLFVPLCFFLVSCGDNIEDKIELSQQQKLLTALPGQWDGVLHSNDLNMSVPFSLNLSVGNENNSQIQDILGTLSADHWDSQIDHGKGEFDYQILNASIVDRGLVFNVDFNQQVNSSTLCVSWCNQAEVPWLSCDQMSEVFSYVPEYVQGEYGFHKCSEFASETATSSVPGYWIAQQDEDTACPVIQIDECEDCGFEGHQDLFVYYCGVKAKVETSGDQPAWFESDPCAEHSEKVYRGVYICDDANDVVCQQKPGKFTDIVRVCSDHDVTDCQKSEVEKDRKDYGRLNLVFCDDFLHNTLCDYVSGVPEEQEIFHTYCDPAQAPSPADCMVVKQDDHNSSDPNSGSQTHGDKPQSESTSANTSNPNQSEPYFNPCIPIEVCEQPEPLPAGSGSTDTSSPDIAPPVQACVQKIVGGAAAACQTKAQLKQKAINRCAQEGMTFSKVTKFDLSCGAVQAPAEDDTQEVPNGGTGNSGSGSSAGSGGTTPPSPSELFKKVEFTCCPQPPPPPCKVVGCDIVDPNLGNCTLSQVVSGDGSTPPSSGSNGSASPSTGTSGGSTQPSSGTGGTSNSGTTQTNNNTTTTSTVLPPPNQCIFHPKPQMPDCELLVLESNPPQYQCKNNHPDKGECKLIERQIACDALHCPPSGFQCVFEPSQKPDDPQCTLVQNSDGVSECINNIGKGECLLQQTGVVHPEPGCDTSPMGPDCDFDQPAGSSVMPEEPPCSLDESGTTPVCINNIGEGPGGGKCVLKQEGQDQTASDCSSSPMGPECDADGSANTNLVNVCVWIPNQPPKEICIWIPEDKMNPCLLQTVTDQNGQIQHQCVAAKPGIGECKLLPPQEICDMPASGQTSGSTGQNSESGCKKRPPQCILVPDDPKPVTPPAVICDQGKWVCVYGKPNEIPAHGFIEPGPACGDIGQQVLAEEYQTIMKNQVCIGKYCGVQAQTFSANVDPDAKLMNGTFPGGTFTAEKK